MPLTYVTGGTQTLLQGKHQTPGDQGNKAIWPHGACFFLEETSNRNWQGTWLSKDTAPGGKEWDHLEHPRAFSLKLSTLTIQQNHCEALICLVLFQDPCDGPARSAAKLQCLLPLWTCSLGILASGAQGTASLDCSMTVRSFKYGERSWRNEICTRSSLFTSCTSSWEFWHAGHFVIFLFIKSSSLPLSAKWEGKSCNQVSSQPATFIIDNGGWSPCREENCAETVSTEHGLEGSSSLRTSLGGRILQICFDLWNYSNKVSCQGKTEQFYLTMSRVGMWSKRVCWKSLPPNTCFLEFWIFLQLPNKNLLIQGLARTRECPLILSQGFL